VNFFCVVVHWVIWLGILLRSWLESVAVVFVDGGGHVDVVTFVFFFIVLYMRVGCCFESSTLVEVFLIFLEWSDPWASAWDVRWVICVYSLDDRFCFAWSLLGNLIYFMLS